MAPKPELVGPDTLIAGVMTVKCECGWEMVTIQPEEAIALLQLVFVHLKEVHGVNFPNICCFWH